MKNSKSRSLFLDAHAFMLSPCSKLNINNDLQDEENFDCFKRFHEVVFGVVN